MAEDEKRTVDEEMVRQLARLAELELDAERQALVAEQLDDLLGEATLVNRFMAGRREVEPGVRFHHPDLDDDEQ